MIHFISVSLLFGVLCSQHEWDKNRGVGFSPSCFCGFLTWRPLILTYFVQLNVSHLEEEHSREHLPAHWIASVAKVKCKLLLSGQAMIPPQCQRHYHQLRINRHYKAALLSLSALTFEKIKALEYRIGSGHQLLQTQTQLGHLAKQL